MLKSLMDAVTGTNQLNYFIFSEKQPAGKENEVADPHFASNLPFSYASRVEDLFQSSPVQEYLKRNGSNLTNAFEFDAGLFDRFSRASWIEGRYAPPLQRKFSGKRHDGLQVGDSGGDHFHRVREEVLFPLAGEVKVRLEDIYGDSITHTLTAHAPGIHIPPFIRHSYEIVDVDDLTGDARFFTILSTQYNPLNPLTYDSFSVETFRDLQDSARTNKLFLAYQRLIRPTFPVS